MSRRAYCGILSCLLAGALTAAGQNAPAPPAQASAALTRPAPTPPKKAAAKAARRKKTAVANADGQRAGDSVTSAQAASPPAAAPPGAMDAGQIQIPTPGGGGAPPALVKYPILTIQGFADIDFSAQNHEAERVGTDTGFTPPGPSSGFDLGQFVLHFTGALSPRVSYFAEVSWTANAGGFTTTIERSIIQYAYSDYFKVSAGRYHTPIIYWNTAYHHGLWLQTTISRPEMIQFGGRLIPVHFVGLLAQGAVPDTGSFHLHYDLGIGNGRGANIAEPGNAGDSNNDRAWLATLYAQPDWAYKWEFGGSVYRDKIGPADGILGSYNEQIDTVRLIDTGETPEILAEAANIQHSRIGAPGVWNSQAWYVQFAYRLPLGQAKWKPYTRYEYIHVPLSDPVFNPPGNPVPSLSGWLGGVRYDFSAFAALKVEYRVARRIANEPRIQGLFVQTALVF